jgi:Na+/melibiose symporter-like transporter
MNRRTLILYALPAFALAMPTIPVFVYLPTFYAESLGIGLTATGLALLVARSLDVVSDPLVGLASDRWSSRWGRRKPWIAAGAGIAGTALIALFMPPEGSGPVYLALWAVALFLGWTLVSIPYNAWGAELSTDYHERARITGAREAAMVLGVVVAGAMPAVAVALGGEERHGLAAVAWTAVLVGGPSILLLLWRVADGAGRPAVKDERTPLRPDLAALLANKPFLRLMSGWFVNGLANGLPAVLFPLYLQYGLGAGPIARGVLIFAYFFAGIVAIPMWLWLNRRYGKHRVWCWAMIMACAAFVWVPFIEPGRTDLFLIVCIVTGMALGADLSLPPAMQADVIDLDSLRSGHRRAGLFFSLWSMATKLSLALAVGVAFPLLDVFGFVPGPDNDPLALLALTVIYAVVPTVLKVVAIFVVWNHPITAHRQSVIRRRLETLEQRKRMHGAP